MRDLIRIGIGGGAFFSGLLFYKNDSKFHKAVTVPIIHCLDPETSHNLAVWSLKYKLIPSITKKYSEAKLHTNCLGLHFKSPIGLAAGFDKDAVAVEGLMGLGFGMVEIGSVTPLPQEGNPKPRVFRLSDDKAVINRYGFNSAGHEVVASNLSQLPPPGERQAVVGVNLGKNKISVDPVEDYKKGVRSLGPYADYLVINVSSPNTPGLRGLQSGGALGELLDGVMKERNLLPKTNKNIKYLPLLVKIAPDLNIVELKEICDVLLKKKVDGIIVSNTTVERPSHLKSIHKAEVGGLSGKPLEDTATKTIGVVYKYTKGKLPIIGVGGVSDGEGVYRKLKAGASLVQLYTSMIYGGPSIVRDLEEQLLQIMKEKNVLSVEDIKKECSFQLDESVI